LKGNLAVNRFIASVSSYSHLSEILIFSTNSNILESNLYIPKLARFQMYSFGFSTTDIIFQSESTLNIQYFSGFSTSFTSTQYQLKFEILFKSILLNIVSQFKINTSSSDFIQNNAAAVHFSSH